MATTQDFPGLIYKRGSTYHYQVWIPGKGHWRRTTRTGNLQKAIAVARGLYEVARLLSERRDGLPRLQEAIVQETARLEQTSPGRASRSSYSLIPFAAWAGDVTIDRVDDALLKEYVAHRAKAGRSRDTIAKDAYHIRAMMKANGIDVARPQIPDAAGETPGRPFSVDELKAFFKASETYPANDPGRYTPLFLLLLATGARPAELVPSPRSKHVALLKKEIDLVDGTVLIRGAKRRAGRKTRTAKVPVNPQILRACLDRAPAGPHVFPEMVITQDFNRILARTGIAKIDELGEKVTAHSFRHTYGTMLAEQGANAFVIQNILRHADPRMTSRYLDRATASVHIVDLSEFLPKHLPEAVPGGA